MRSLSVSVDRRAGRVLIGLTVLLSALLELEANSFENALKLLVQPVTRLAVVNLRLF